MADCVAVQLFASVNVTEYVPADSPVIKFIKVPVDQR